MDYFVNDSTFCIYIPGKSSIHCLGLKDQSSSAGIQELRFAFFIAHPNATVQKAYDELCRKCIVCEFPCGRTLTPYKNRSLGLAYSSTRLADMFGSVTAAGTPGSLAVMLAVQTVAMALL